MNNHSLALYLFVLVFTFVIAYVNIDLGCNSFSASNTTLVTTHNLEMSEQILFEKYRWVENYIDPAMCTTGDRILVYQSGHYDYLSIRHGDDEILYSGDGRAYCSSSSNNNCQEFYFLGAPIYEWTCDGDKLAVISH